MSEAIDEGAVGRSRDADDACRRLDFAISGFNRHTRVMRKQHELIESLRRTRDRYAGAAGAPDQGLTADMVGAGELCRGARDVASRHRLAIERSVATWVRLLRDAGTPPERVLVLVKQRLVANIRPDAPPAPAHDARALESDVSGWVIAAYYAVA